MIEQISLALVSESGDVLPVETPKNFHAIAHLETTIAATFSEICFRHNSIADAEIQTAEKFFFALNLKNYLEEIKRNDRF